MPLSRGRRTRFKKIMRNRSAIHFYQYSACASAVVMNRTRDEFLARSRFTRDEDGGIGRGHLLDLRKECFQCRAVPFEPTEILLNFGFQIIVLLLHPDLQGVN